MALLCLGATYLGSMCTIILKNEVLKRYLAGIDGYSEASAMSLLLRRVSPPHNHLSTMTASIDPVQSTMAEESPTVKLNGGEVNA